MRSLAFLTITVLTITLAFIATSNQPSKAEEIETVVAKKKVLRHVVLFKFKKSATKKQVQNVVDEFAKLPKKIDTIIDFEMGTDVSVENLSKGFTHGFVVTFNNAAGRKTYLPHPAHKAFVKIVGPVIDEVLVFDYYTTE
jgi:hypothetical protein